MSIFQKEQSQALLSLLQSVHAEHYQGLDDEMVDDCNEWIGSLTDEELCEIVLDIFRNGL